MNGYSIVLHALVGAWNTQDIDGCGVIKISEDVESLERILGMIADSKAGDYVTGFNGEISEEVGRRLYEISDNEGRWAKFYITDHYVKLPLELMGAISRKMEEIDRTDDVTSYLRRLYESENLEEWKYEYAYNSIDVIKAILQELDRMEDCNTPYNTTMELAAEKVLKEISCNDTVLEFLWERFGDIAVDDDGCLLEYFIGFDIGDNREDVWHWFDERHSKGVAHLMNGGDKHGWNSNRA